ncbi:MAG: MacB family efflux pump subunit [Kiloniellales bacterium]
MSAAPLIELAGVTKTYNRGDLSVEVLHGISLTIRAGEFVAIKGTSGSGKSTLMNLLGCIDQPSSGQYLFCGVDVTTLAPDEVARLRRDAFGFVFQSFNLIPGASAVENVEVPAIYAGTPAWERRERAERLLSMLGLGERLDHQPNQLSGGQQQRTAVARALMNGGKVIFADEPTGALDSQSSTEVMALLRQLHGEGHTIILITHDDKVAQCAERIIEFRDGAIVSDSGLRRLSVVRAPAATDFGGARGGSLLAEAREAFRMALRALRANRLRTLLTLLGIVIGVASVIAMLAVGDGAKQQVLDRISSMGTNLLVVRPGTPHTRGSRGAYDTLVPTDVDAIARLPNVVAALPEVTGNAVLRFGNADYEAQVNATGPDLPVVRDWRVASGSFFGEADVTGYAPVVVLGQTVADRLYPSGADPIGSLVVIDNVAFRVIGVMAIKGASPWGSDLDDVAFVPVSTGSLRLFGRTHLRSITVLVDDLSQIDSTEDAVRQLLIQRHRVEDFRIRNTASVMATASETSGTLTLLLGSIAAISLLVGGIGVMNIMLVSVTERTREIGIRMAVGARTADILQQFLIEAVVVSGIGGLVGAAGGLAAASLLERLGMPVVLSSSPVLLAFGCAFATGLVFGYLPARKAAHLNPVVALGAK